MFNNKKNKSTIYIKYIIIIIHDFIYKEFKYQHISMYN